MQLYAFQVEGSIGVVTVDNGGGISLFRHFSHERVDEPRELRTDELLGVFRDAKPLVGHVNPSMRAALELALQAALAKAERRGADKARGEHETQAQMRRRILRET